MADNKKISGFSEENDITKIDGLAGYKVGIDGAPNTNVKISGNQLKDQVLEGFEPEVGWDNISGKPETFPPITGTEATQAMPGDTTIPTTTSQLTNNSGFITEAEVPDPEWDNVQNKPATFPKTRSKMQGLSSSGLFLIAVLGCTGKC